MNEQKLIRKLRKGKEKAYRYLFSEYYDWLCNYVFSLCNDRSLAEDIVQDAIVALWEKRKVIIITTSLKNYLFKTCHNQFLQHVRSQKIKFDTLDKIRWDVVSEATLEDDLYDFRMEKLKRLIDGLPPRCREIFVQNKLEEKKYKEIALEMGISVKTVENQMSKALHFLRANATTFML
ncbi:RNA polymerase sigma-70 factor, ECF subfamily [Pricia antarctica]|uniref:RNA polymerase sigma-70 factor, ECF subfamily n=1 Tax=Pricia antarctica TaxID=641691 RepID=A0A1G7IZK9_9FLAO|nr:RNA polymerase sigma-70 factor [Pricia antarctica]SDF18065.1 RNA polymerase sigma-70 factor, ECF subfamily [Pricia antarctica]